MPSDDDRSDRWHVRGCSPAARDLALDAARRADISLGEWLERAIRAFVNAERETGFPVAEVMIDQDVTPGEVEALEPQPGRELTIAEIGQVIAIAAKIKELRGGKAPTRLIASAARVLLERCG